MMTGKLERLRELERLQGPTGLQGGHVGFPDRRQTLQTLLAQMTSVDPHFLHTSLQKENGEAVADCFDSPVGANVPLSSRICFSTSPPSE